MASCLKPNMLTQAAGRSGILQEWLKRSDQLVFEDGDLTAGGSNHTSGSSTLPHHHAPKVCKTSSYSKSSPLVGLFPVISCHTLAILGDLAPEVMSWTPHWPGHVSFGFQRHLSCLDMAQVTLPLKLYHLSHRSQPSFLAV